MHGAESSFLNECIAEARSLHSVKLIRLKHIRRTLTAGNSDKTIQSESDPLPSSHQVPCMPVSRDGQNIVGPSSNSTQPTRSRDASSGSGDSDSDSDYPIGDVHVQPASGSDAEEKSSSSSSSSGASGVRVTRANDVTGIQLLLNHSGPASRGATPLLISLTGAEYFIKPAVSASGPGIATGSGSYGASGTSSADTMGSDSESEDSDHWHDDRILLHQFPKPGARVTLEHDGTNARDRNAIRVLTAPSADGGKVIGNVERNLCPSLLPFLRVVSDDVRAKHGRSVCDFFEAVVSVSSVEHVPERRSSSAAGPSQPPTTRTFTVLDLNGKARTLIPGPRLKVYAHALE